MESSIYKNLISNIDINRGLDSIDYFHFNDIKEQKFQEFVNDLNKNNDSIELNLIKNNAYKEAVIMSLHIINDESDFLREIIRDEQKTFGGSKLFYINDNHDKILVVSVAKSMEGKLNMVINRLNKINDKINRLNGRIRRENLDIYMKRHNKDKKETIVNMINMKLKV